MQMPAQSLGRELELLEYRMERIEQLLSDGIVSAEMEFQLRHTLALLERESESIRSARFAPAHRQAA
jgi:hypothetical protein